MHVQLWCLAISILIGSSCAGKLPSYIQPCSASEPNSKLNQCVHNVITKVTPQFAKGIPELGVEPLDPAKLDTIVVNNPALKITFEDTVVTGLAGASINSFKLNKARDKATIDFTANVTLKANYDMDGQILIVPIKGRGQAKIKITNLNIVIAYDYSTVNGFWTMLGHKDSYKMDHATFKFTNLFNGNKQLGDTTNKFLNENWSIIMDEVAPQAIDQIIEYCLKVIGKLFEAIPAAELQPL